MLHLAMSSSAVDRKEPASPRGNNPSGVSRSIDAPSVSTPDGDAGTEKNYTRTDAERSFDQKAVDREKEHMRKTASVSYREQVEVCLRLLMSTVLVSSRDYLLCRISRQRSPANA